MKIAKKMGRRNQNNVYGEMDKRCEKQRQVEMYWRGFHTGGEWL